MNYLSKSSLCLLAVVTSLTATAQETLSDKLQYKVTGRMLMDLSLIHISEPTRP
mgnify:CR=1 FL=1